QLSEHGQLSERARLLAARVDAMMNDDASDDANGAEIADDDPPRAPEDRGEDDDRGPREAGALRSRDDDSGGEREAAESRSRDDDDRGVREASALRSGDDEDRGVREASESRSDDQGDGGERDALERRGRED